MKYKAWDKSGKVEKDFEKALNKFTEAFKRLASKSNSISDFQDKMDRFQQSKEFQDMILLYVRRMVTPIATMNMSTWRKAARKATKNPFLYNLLLQEINSGLASDIEKQIHENALLIRTLPNDTANKVVEDIYGEGLQGLRSSEIAKHIRKYTDQHARASAKLIARTETSKTMSALTEARSKNLNLNWYVWRTEQDGDRVRPSHRIMEGVLVNFSDPPSPEQLAGLPSVGTYHAGNIWNCRCYEEPLIDIDDVSWPHKVHINGQIKTMSKKEFEVMM